MKATFLLIALSLIAITIALRDKPTENKTGITDDANEDDNVWGL